MADVGRVRDRIADFALRAQPLKRLARAVLGGVALGLGSGTHAAGLFLPVGTAGTAVDAAPAAKSVSARRSVSVVPDAWERRVRVARRELAVAREDVQNAGAGRLLLNVKDGVRLDAMVERTAPTKWGYSLSGRVAGGGYGFMTLVVHEEAVAGSIWTPDAAYELRYLGGGVHVLQDVTNAPPVECGGASPTELPSADATGPKRRRLGVANQDGVDGVGDVSVVDILVVWTPAAEVRYGGGEPQVLSSIEWSIAYVNDAFERSGAFVSLNLVGAEKVDYMEEDWSIDLGRLVNAEDGYMDGVHDRRSALGADLVYLLHSRSGGLARGSFSIGATGGTFAHEIGHNFGIGHERYDFLAGLGPSGYDHGFTTERCNVSIVSYGLECWRRSLLDYTLPFYASPWRYSPRNGLPLGVSRFSKERGTRGPADAVLTVNRIRHRVANLRPTRAGE